MKTDIKFTSNPPKKKTVNRKKILTLYRNVYGRGICEILQVLFTRYIGDYYVINNIT